jgi:hypothetical protein
MHLLPRLVYGVGDISDQANAFLRSSMPISIGLGRYRTTYKCLPVCRDSAAPIQTVTPPARNIIASQFLKPKPPLKLRQSQSPSERESRENTVTLPWGSQISSQLSSIFTTSPVSGSHPREAAGPRAQVYLPTLSAKPFLPKHEQRNIASDVSHSCISCQPLHFSSIVQPHLKSPSPPTQFKDN